MTSVAHGEVSARSWRLRIATLGPGIVFVLTVVGMGDLVTNATLGATHGYAFLWLLLVGVLFRFVWLDTAARYVLVSGETLLEGFARLGRPIVLVLFIVAPLLCHLTNLARVALVGEAIQLIVPLPGAYGAAIYSLVFTGLALLTVLRGGYDRVEMLCKWLISMLGIGLLVAAALSGPDPAGIVRGLIPSIPPGAGARATLLMVTALIGTEAGSLTNLTYASFLREKGWRDTSALLLQRRDLLFSIGAIFTVGLLTQVAASGALGGTGVSPQNARDLVLIFADRLGAVGVALFALGFAGKIFSSSVGVTTGYSLIITELGRRYVPGLRRDATGPDASGAFQHDPMFRAVAALLLVSPLYVLLTDWKPVLLVLLGQGAMVVLLPVVSYGLVRLTRKRERMGRYASGPVRTALLLLMAAVSLWMLWKNVAAWVGPGA